MSKYGHIDLPCGCRIVCWYMNLPALVRKSECQLAHSIRFDKGGEPSVESLDTDSVAYITAIGNIKDPS